MAATLSVVCPVWNEAANIGATLDELRAKVHAPIELLVVYDRDEDDTLPVVRRIAASYPFQIRLVKNAHGPGVLNALRTGFDAATGDAVLVVMADLSDDFRIVDDMLRLVEHGCDVVCGSRYMPGGAHVGGPALKTFLSRTAGLSLHAMLGLPSHDVSNSFKMYRRTLLDEIRIESTGGFEIGIEILVKAWVKGKRIAELPSVWQDRTKGTSRFQLWAWLPSYLRWYFYAFRRTSPAPDRHR